MNKYKALLNYLSKGYIRITNCKSINGVLRKSLFLFFLFSNCRILSAQGVVYPLYNEAIYYHIDRFGVLYGSNKFLFTASKAYTRGDVTKYALFLDSSKMNLSKIDKAALQYIIDDNNDMLSSSELPATLTGKSESIMDSTNSPPQYKINKEPILKYFYKTPANLFEVNTRFFNLKINPILNIKIADERNDEQPIFLNQRGVELRGCVDNRVYFYTNILETQSRFPNYISNWIEKHGAIPSVALYKTYNSLVFKIKNGYDYLNAQGHIGFNVTPHIGVQIGNGQHFLGDGIRSLFLSNFANNYFYLKFNTKVWKFQYQNIFAELNAISANSNSVNFKKYMALHQLSLNVSQNLNFGIFETVIMNRTKQFELQYLNPIILYRSVEHSLGSPDNVLVGANFKWNVAKHYSFYGQVILDEFAFKELFIDNKGWWANKYGVQLGAKYFNAFNIDHLDLQVEYNKVRPFTYSYYDSYRNYTHALQNLAHPLGSNFKEVLVRARFQPIWKLVFDSRFMYANIGESSDTKNWGNEPIVANDTKQGEFGYFTTEGVKAKILQMTLDVSYQFYHNMFADIYFLARKKDSQDATRNERTSYVGGGLRVNFGNVRNDF